MHFFIHLNDSLRDHLEHISSIYINKRLTSVLGSYQPCTKWSAKLLPASGCFPNPFTSPSLYTSFTIKLKCSSPEGAEEKNEKKAMMKHSSPASSGVRYSQSYLRTHARTHFKTDWFVFEHGRGPEGLRDLSPLLDKRPIFSLSYCSGHHFTPWMAYLF